VTVRELLGVGQRAAEHIVGAPDELAGLAR